MEMAESSHTLDFKIVYRECDGNLENHILHRVENKDLTFLKAVVRISESQRGIKGN